MSAGKAQVGSRPEGPSPEQAPPGAGMPGQYVPADHEARIRAAWERVNLGHADPARVDRGAEPTHDAGTTRPPYSIFMPPPNVTGQLHLGHALNNTLQDVLTRAHRMMGYEALWMPGTDHAGIATQAVVERRLREEGKIKGPLRQSMSREEFVAQVGMWKDEYEARITEQLKAMGCSCDFARQRFTMDDICARAVREAFFRLFADGLIYRGKRLVNWDPALQTAVSDDECYEEDVDTSFWYLRYPLVSGAGAPPGAPLPITWAELSRRGYPGAADHPPGAQAWVTVATTRPETYLGDTAVAVSQHDPRAAALEGLFALLPLVGRTIPIIVDTSGYVVLPKAMGGAALQGREGDDPKSEYATGFLKVTPAHDVNDYELGQRYAEQIARNSTGRVLINMMSPDGRVSDRFGWTDVCEAGVFVGKKMSEARKLVVAEFEARGLLEATRPYRQGLTFSDRSKAVIEPYLSDQWYVRVTDDRMKGAANRALDGTARAGCATSEGTLTFHPPRYAKTYQQWHENIRDWCISRQLWWGHRIPVWSKTVAEAEADAARRGLGPDSGVVVQSEALGEGRVTLHACVGPGRAAAERLLIDGGFAQEADVLDTWFSSALWPMSTLGWPDPDQSDQTRGMLAAFNPSVVLSTAREIITLWVSRMVMMNRYLLPEGWPGAAAPEGRSTLERPGFGRGPVPFRDVFIHAVVQDEKGKRMSKSAGNGVDPLDIIQTHGADALRFTLCQMTTQTQDVRLPVRRDAKTGKNTSAKFDLGRNFCNKLWNAARFASTLLSGAERAPGAARAWSAADLSLADRWMLSRLHGAVREASVALANYEFSAYAQGLYDIVWRDFCDWYLEAIKPTAAGSPGTRAVLLHTLEAILRLAHPLLPFVTEAIYERVRHLDSDPVAGIDFGPRPREGLLALAPWPRLDSSLHDGAAEARFGRMRALVEAVRRVRAERGIGAQERIKLHAPGALRAELSGLEHMVAALAGLSGVGDLELAAGTAASEFTLEGERLFLSGFAGVDESAKKAKHEQEVALLTKEVARLRERLASENYLAKAPGRLVEETRADLAGKLARLEALQRP